MTTRIIRTHYTKGESDKEKCSNGEWLITNGLGGYASGSILGSNSRTYHGLLVAPLPPPYGRTIILNHLTEILYIGEKMIVLNAPERTDQTNPHPIEYLKSFYLDNGLPVWIYEIEDIIIEKRILLTYRQNTVFFYYRQLQGEQKVTIKFIPLVHFRSYEGPLHFDKTSPYEITLTQNTYKISYKEYPPLRFSSFGSKSGLTIETKMIPNVKYRIEQVRGYEHVEELWTPGFFTMDLEKGKEVGLVASCEPWRNMYSLTAEEAMRAEVERRKQLLMNSKPLSNNPFCAELILAADQFIISPLHRIEDQVRAHAKGDEIRTIIAGYHWFTDWGRDTMISLEGLTLCSGRSQEARWILKTFAHYVKDGLIPNMFPDKQNLGLYHTVDATLWFFHAIERYYAHTSDFYTLEEIFPKLVSIIEYHIKGTHFGIKRDEKDGLLHEGAEGFQLTWMDAKVGDWVVTPRRGKPVEINALWYNSLRLMEEWMKEKGEKEKSEYYGSLAAIAYDSFNKKFWIEEKGYLFDVIEGDGGNDEAFRPNQLFAISLKYPILDPSRWKSVVELCKEKLFTPFGLRTLSMDHPDFKARYEGDLWQRDSSYHQGTVWPWLMGPFIDSWLKIYPEDKRGAEQMIAEFETVIGESGVGTIAEIFDATTPHRAQGCMAQAWSIAEILRLWIKTR